MVCSLNSLLLSAKINIGELDKQTGLGFPLYKSRGNNPQSSRESYCWPLTTVALIRTLITSVQPHRVKRIGELIAGRLTWTNTHIFEARTPHPVQTGQPFRHCLPQLPNRRQPSNMGSPLPSLSNSHACQLAKAFLVCTHALTW